MAENTDESSYQSTRSYLMEACDLGNSSLANNAEHYINLSFERVESSGITYFIVFVAILVLFSVLLRAARTRVLLAPKFVKESHGMPVPIVGWFSTALRGRKAIKSEHVDGAVLISFCWLGFKFFAAGSCVGVYLSWYYRRYGNEDRDFNTYTIINLAPNEAPEFYDCHLMPVIVCAYTLTIFFDSLLIKEWRKFKVLRHSYCKRAAVGELGAGAAQVYRSIIVERVPKVYRSKEKVEEYFTYLFGKGSVHSTVMLEDTRADHGRTDARVHKFLSAVKEDITPEVEQEHKVSAGDLHMHESESGINLLDFPTDEDDGVIKRANWQRKIFRDATLGREGSNTAFVTFNKVQHKLLATQTNLGENLAEEMPHWDIASAPEVRDIIWSNITIPAIQFQRRQGLMHFICIVGFLFWSLPVVGIQAAANPNVLKQWIPAIHDLQHLGGGRLYLLLVTYLPLWALMLLIVLLPKLFMWMAVSYEGHKTKSGAMREALKRSFWYQVFTVFLSMLSGSAFMSISWFVQLEGVDCLYNVMATELPRRAAYFITFVIARSGFSVPMLLLYPWIFNVIPCLRVEKPDDPDHRPTVYCQFEAEAVDLAIVFFLGTTYMLIAPAIMFVCMIYFALATFVYMWLFAYAYDIEFEGKGHLWYVLSDGIMAGFLFGLLCFSSIVYAFAPLGVEWFATWSLFILQLLFSFVIRRHLPSEDQFLTFEEAVIVDYEWNQSPDTGYRSGVVAKSLDPGFYTDPVYDAVNDNAQGSSCCCCPCVSDDDDVSDTEDSSDKSIYTLVSSEEDDDDEELPPDRNVADRNTGATGQSRSLQRHVVERSESRVPLVSSSLMAEKGIALRHGEAMIAHWGIGSGGR